jgi:hypothetical protein
MKLTYDFIKKNLEVYNEVREKLSILKDYEEKLVDYNIMSNLNLEKFAIFYDQVIKMNNFHGFDNIICDYSFKDLKKIIIDSTKTIRYKSLIKNKTKPKFNQIFSDRDLFDRLLNGTWKTKPSLNRNGRMSYGTRKREKVDGFNNCLIPLLNYLIINEIEVAELDSRYQGNYYTNVYKYFTTDVLTTDVIPMNEIMVTNTFLHSLVSKIESENINYKSLNLDYIIGNIKSKLSRLMQVEPGTKLKSKNDFNSRITGNSILTKDKIYDCVSSSIIKGSLNVVIVDDFGHNRTFPYDIFEDIAQRRDDLLSLLFD